MGASGWHYKVPYNDDAGGALQQLRQEVFASGAYAKAWTGLDDFPPELIAGELAEMAEMAGRPVDPASIDRLAAGEDPVSIDEALLWSMDSGTHSILDIVNGIGHEPDFGIITPFARAAYIEVFGTERPSEAAVEAQLMNLDSMVRERWQGI